MIHRWLMVGLIVVLGTAHLTAQERETESIKFRVTSALPNGNLFVDLGKRQGVEVGDRVFLRPRKGGNYEGRVIRVDERSSLVEVTDKRLRAVAGMEGVVLIPKSRFAAEPDPDRGARQAEEGKPETEPKWQNKDEEYKVGMPLLKTVRPVRPENRPLSIRGRAYAIMDLVGLYGSDYDNSIFRVGTDVLYDNLLGVGGGLHINAEANYKNEQNRQSGGDLLVRRLSYHRGGNRFTPGRLEVGRFLQHGMPEFGVLDGVEWGYRQKEGSRFGGSFGWMPTLDDDFDTGQDSQLAAYYEWVSDLRELLVLSAGYQKTFHNDHSDRDLLVAKMRYLPYDAWQVNGTLWVDFYVADDVVKGSGVELTQALVSTTRRWSKSGVDLTFRRLLYPELLRTGDFLPLDPGALNTKRYDRLSFDGWKESGRKTRVRGQINLWNDERGAGVGGEIGVDADDWFAQQSLTNLALFGGNGSFESTAGVRVSYGRFNYAGRWDLLYEVTFHHFTGFTPATDDMIQHRMRASQSWYAESGWDISVHADGHIWAGEFSWAIGMQVQKSF